MPACSACSLAGDARGTISAAGGLALGEQRAFLDLHASRCAIRALGWILTLMRWASGPRAARIEYATLLPGDA